MSEGTAKGQVIFPVATYNLKLINKESWEKHRLDALLWLPVNHRNQGTQAILKTSLYHLCPKLHACLQFCWGRDDCVGQGERPFAILERCGFFGGGRAGCSWGAALNKMIKALLLPWLDPQIMRHVKRPEKRGM